MKKTTIRKRVTAHTFRASLITHMSQMGANTFHIQAQSRHKTLVALKRYIRPNEKQRLENYEAYVPKISNTGINPKQTQLEPKKKPEPENDPMVGNIDENTRLILRYLEIEEEEIRLKLANSNTDNTDMNYQ